MQVIVDSVAATQQFARYIGERLKGGEVIELVGDVGAGKTTLTKGLAEGLGVDDEVQSPSFTISRFYTGRDDLELHHYDFYRLSDPGILKYDIHESTSDSRAVTVVEWAETVADVLPKGRTVLRLAYGAEPEARTITIEQATQEIKEAYATWNTHR